MRQEHRAGEKTFIDYAGQTVDVVVPWQVRLVRPDFRGGSGRQQATPLPRPRGSRVCPT
ncbi:hypothetical protein DFAR_3420011 [Desulfarculales bacterium]